MAILFQQEKVGEEQERSIMSENRLYQKKSDLEKLKKYKNELIDHNFKD